MNNKILKVIVAACIVGSIAGGFFVGKKVEKKKVLKEIEDHFEEKENE